MTSITLGQFTIPIAWIAFFIAIFYSDFRSKNADLQTNALICRLFWMYIFTWKLSYIVFSWTSFIQAPLSIIYFDGGFYGHLLAIVVGVFLILRKRLSVNFEVLVQYWARVVAVSQLLTFLLMTQWLLAVVWLVVLLVIEFKWTNSLLPLQWGLLLWIHGVVDPYVFIHALILILVFVKHRQKQLIAFITISTLVALMLTDIDTNTSTVNRKQIDLMTTEQERYVLANKPQQVTVVNFFATWCPPCQAEMPHLQSFAQNLPEGVELIGINLTSRDNGNEALQQFIEKYGVTYPILLDNKDFYGKAYEVMSIPTTVILDKNGEELQRIVGPVSEHNLRNILVKYY